jgi:membrane peptidoglycan carboxypeptidase
VLAAAVLLPFVGGLGVVAGNAAAKFLNMSCDVTVSPASQTTTVLANDGKTVIATLFSQNRQNVALAEMPLTLQQALISTEDRTFYSNNGVDLRSIARAALSNITGSTTQGGSTLTMQYVKELRYFQATTAAQQQAAVQQTVQRKLQDIQCALQLEKKYTKAQILQSYLNISFFGENSYGIQTAARTYFGVSASKLTLPQSAMLVGMLQSPTAYDPFINPQAAKTRRNQVINNMVATGAVTPAQGAKYKAAPVTLATSAPPPVAQGCANANPAISNVGFFCDYLVHWLETTGGISQSKLQTGGLTIVTTLDASLQNSGQAAVWQSGLNAASPTVLVTPAVDPATGAVQSMITSRHYGLAASSGQTTLPLFTTGYAGAGSTYKYFTALAALKLGVPANYTLTTGSSAYTVKNCPLGTGQTPYTTHNAGSYQATLPLSDALPESVNTYFVGMEDQLFGCDLTPVVNTALGLGMTALNAPQTAGSNQSIAQAVIAQHQSGFTLGFAPTSALELTAAYGAIANDGIYCPATPVVKITGPDGSPVPYSKPGCTRQFSPSVARTMLNIMTTDTTSSKGTAASYFQNWYNGGGSPIASKTGTDNDDPNGPDGGTGNSALWFVGVTPKLVAAAALVNPSAPKATITGLPAGVANNGTDVFGAYASTYWLQAYGPMLQTQQWSWPSASNVPGVAVPDVSGQDSSTAATTLSNSGFRAAVAGVRCGSAVPAGAVAFYEPHVAAPGTAITLCLSSGVNPGGGNDTAAGGTGSAAATPTPSFGAVPSPTASSAQSSPRTRSPRSSPTTRSSQ